MPRDVVVRPGRHFGWWIEGRKSNGAHFMMVWWPTEGVARSIGRWAAGR